MNQRRNPGCRTGISASTPKGFLWASIVVSLFTVSSGHAQLVPVGDETLVNNLTTTGAVRPTVALDDSGQFLVVWQSGNTATDPDEILGRRFDADGLAVGDEFQINDLTRGGQGRPAIGLKPGGGFVVVWDSDVSAGTDTDGLSIQGRQLAADGSLAGPEFQINSTTSGSQLLPALAMHPEGDFLVVWISDESQGDDSDSTSIQGQRFDALGTPVGSEFQVNSYTTSLQVLPTAAPWEDGFVVTWHSDFGSPGDDNDRQSVHARFVDANGPLARDFQVNTYTTNDQAYPRIASMGTGFVVLWESQGSPGDDDLSWSVQGQRFDAAGDPRGGQFQVNTYTTDAQTRSSVTWTSSQEMLVVWKSGSAFLGGLDGDEGGIALQTLDADGGLLGAELLVNTSTEDNQSQPEVATNPQGDVVVVWVDFEGFPNNEVLFQRFFNPNAPLFQDGFESGDTTAWSSSSLGGLAPRPGSSPSTPPRP